jgi:hypothetical protein
VDTEGHRVDRSRLAHRLVLTLAIAGFAYVALTLPSDPSAAVLLDLAVTFIAIVFLLHARPRPQQHGSCANCGAVEDPVRSVGGRRLWTCRQCGMERPRHRTRRQIEARAA